MTFSYAINHLLEGIEESRLMWDSQFTIAIHNNPANAGLMLVHRLRHWPSIKLALGHRPVFAGRYLFAKSLFDQNLMRWMWWTSCILGTLDVSRQFCHTWTQTYNWQCNNGPMSGYRQTRWPVNDQRLICCVRKKIKFVNVASRNDWNVIKYVFGVEQRIIYKT